MPEPRRSTADLSPEELSLALQRQRDAWRAANPGKPDDEMPEGLKASAPAKTSWLSSFVAKLGEIAGFALTPDQIAVAYTHAREHSATTRQPKRTVDAATYRRHETQHPTPVQGCEYCYGFDVNVEKLPKADARVSYRTADEAANEKCAACRFYRWGSCALVEGSIEARDVCDLYLPPVQTYIPASSSIYVAADSATGGWKLFVEQRRLTDAPEWINVLPPPGIYSHPIYGWIDITPERNQRFVQNFDDRVYQQDLAIQLDINHDGSSSGAIGYFEELRLADDGSVEARVAWTDRGKGLIEADAFKYFSPEWWDEWTDPLTLVTYHDVLSGGAICNEPFFKEHILRPMVSTARGLFIAAPESTPKTIWLQPLAIVPKEEVHVPDVQPVAMTEEQSKEFTELKARVAAQESALQASEEARKAAEAGIKKLSQQEQRRRFTDLVRGRDGANDGAAWPGEIEKHVDHLIALAESQPEGEESEVFKNHLVVMGEAAKTLKASGIFTNIGTTQQTEVVDDPVEEVERLVKAARAENKDLDEGAATKQVFKANPELYRRYRRASFSRMSDDEE